MTAGGGDHDLARLVRGLSESAWALAALAAALQKDDPHVILEDRQGRVLGVLGLAAPAVGGWRLNPAAASVAASGGGAYAARFIATLRWAAAAEGRLDWAEQDLGTKAALGRESSLAGRVLSGCWLRALAIWLNQIHHAVVIDSLPGLEGPQELAEAAATFLVEVLASFDMAQCALRAQRDGPR